MAFYIFDNGSTLGPMEESEVVQGVHSRRFSATAKACKVGDNEWRPLSEVVPLPNSSQFQWPQMPKIDASSVINGVAAKLTNLAGAETIEGLDGKRFFSEAFKKRSDDDLEQLFITGTAPTTPALSEINTDWPKPWAFFKAFIASVIVLAGFLYGWFHFQNPKLLPGLIFVGSFAIPFSTLILFVELNVPRNVSLYQVFKLCAFGGIGSILISLFLYSAFDAENAWGSALAAGLFEEAAKIGAALVLMRNRRFHWTLNGLLIGAAIGTGFGAFESAGYALNSFFNDLGNALNGSESNEMMWTMGIRALLAPAGHIAWTALAVAALWRVKAGKPFDWPMLKDPRFLRVYALVATLHFLWDAPIAVPLLGDELGLLAKYVLLGIAVWVLLLGYVQVGLKEIRLAQKESSPAPTANSEIVAV
ncbi:MAG TPA: PrsW family glutamic-type intramembrane protease [Chthoniobacter sp.]|jgi:RsiW-degrading membrane proteinase PrsW (M82 family)